MAVATVTGRLVVKDNKYSLGLLEEPKEERGKREKEREREGRGEREGRDRGERSEGRERGERGDGRESRSSSSGAGKLPLVHSKAEHYLYGPLDHQVHTGPRHPPGAPHPP